MRIVCVGDSFTEGMCDELRPDGEHLGWADRVAAALAAGGERVEYANLAVRGKLLDQVVAEQLDPAIALAPDLVTFHAGPNDVLRRGTDLADLCRRYAAAVERVAAASGRVVLFTSIGRTDRSDAIARWVATRFDAFNEGVHAVGARVGAVVVDVGAAASLQDRRVWHTDRLHLNAAGHTRVAAAVLEHLGVQDAAVLGGAPGWWRAPLPPAPPPTRAAALAADLTWAREHFAPWLLRRLRGVSSGDGRAPKDPAPRLVSGR